MNDNIDDLCTSKTFEVSGKWGKDHERMLQFMSSMIDQFYRLPISETAQQVARYLYSAEAFSDEAWKTKREILAGIPNECDESTLRTHIQTLRDAGIVCSLGSGRSGYWLSLDGFWQALPAVDQQTRYSFKMDMRTA